MRAGHAVNVNGNRLEVESNFMQQIGGYAPDSLCELAEKSDVVIIMFPLCTIVSHVLSDA